jgi:hypothetical protein
MWPTEIETVVGTWSFDLRGSPRMESMPAILADGTRELRGADEDTALGSRQRSRVQPDL